MGFLKDSGSLAGTAAGGYFGGAIELVGAVIGSKSMEQKEKRVLTVQEQAIFLEYLHTER